MKLIWTRDAAGLKLNLDTYELGAVYPSEGSDGPVYWGCCYRFVGRHCTTELEAAQQLGARYGLKVKTLPPPRKR